MRRGALIALATGALAGGTLTSCVFSALGDAFAQWIMVPFTPEGAHAVSGADPWSPDGRSLLIATWFAKRPGLFRIGFDGTPPRRLTNGVTLVPVWGNDGRIACSEFDRGRVALRILSEGVALDAPFESTAPLPSGPFMPWAWSPDGDWLAASTGGHVVLLRDDGLGWTDFGPRVFAEWSHDGEFVCVVKEGDEHFIELVEVPSGAQRRLTQGASPSFAPDRQRLAFACDGRIAVLDVEEDSVLDLTAGDAPHWSPRGDYLLYSHAPSETEPLARRLGLIRPDGSDERVLADDARAPRWSPDGTRISFLRGRFPVNELVVIDVDDASELLVLDLFALASDESVEP